VGTDIFPESLDYVALGHLHVPQQVSGATVIRYSGSPIPMGFGEAKQQKIILKVTLGAVENSPVVTPIHVPVFQRLVSVSGDWEKIETALGTLINAPEPEESPVWIDIVYTGSAIIPDLRERIEGSIGAYPLRVLRVKNQRPVAVWASAPEVSLDELTPEEVFDRCLDANHVPEDQRGMLGDVYRETLVGCLSPEGDA
jgi:DNA repair protein SbcD/Mre11